MGRIWPLLDVSQIGWAEFHAKGGLRHNGFSTGVSYGVMSKILTLQEEFGKRTMVFCFDHGRSRRYDMCSTYKESRQARRASDEREQATYSDVCRQINALRTKHLPAIGFRNLFYQKGFEADDVIASVCHNLPEGDKAVIVSTDEDMFQLLSNNVSIYQSKAKMYFTKKLFIKQFGIKPRDWVKVKAIAGCSSDDIHGIKGVGEKTVCAYLTGRLNPTNKKYRLIQEESKRLLKVNTPLVKLPLEGTKVFTPRLDKRDLTWGGVFKELNINSLHPDRVYEE